MKIIVVCVLYNPTDSILQKWKEKIQILPQFFFLFVDNSQKKIFDFENIGIQYAKKNLFDYVVFFDQDSDFSDYYLPDMVQEYNHIKEKFPNLVILGPRIIDKESHKEYKHKDANNNDDYLVCRELISSGSMVKTDDFDKIGLLEEKLFIDYVDFEWCWRAKQNGYVCIKTKKISLMHEVGQRRRSFIGYPIILSSPIRYFYQYRNYFRLIKRSYVPLDWKKKVLVRKIFELFTVPFIYHRNPKTLYYMIKGIVSGLFTI